MNSLGNLNEAYQAQLELLRADPDSEQLQEDLAKAKGALETAWMEVVWESSAPASASEN